MDFGIGQQQHKLFAAVARHQILAARLLLQDMGYQLDRLVTRQMAMAVVDALEMVNIHHHDRQRLGRIGRLCQYLLHALRERIARGQLGQRIELRAVLVERGLAIAQHHQKTHRRHHQLQKQHQTHRPHGQHTAQWQVLQESRRRSVFGKDQRHDGYELHTSRPGDQDPAHARRAFAHGKEHVQGVERLHHRNNGLQPVEAGHILRHVPQRQQQAAQQGHCHHHTVASPVRTLAKALQCHGECRHGRTDQGFGEHLQLHHAQLALQRKEYVRQAKQCRTEHRLRHALAPVLAAQHPQHP